LLSTPWCRRAAPNEEDATRLNDFFRTDIHISPNSFDLFIIEGADTTTTGMA
jgi:hypothetical protein